MASPIVAYNPMFGPITQDNVDNPYTQPGTASPVVNPTNPWWLGQNPNTGQQPWDYAGSPGQAAWENAQQKAPPVNKAANPNAADAGTAKSLLRQYGLDDLVPFVDQWITDGLSMGQINALLYDRGSDVGKIVDKTFPELRRLQELNLAPMSIDQIQQFRTYAKQTLKAAGLSTLATDDFVRDNFLYKDKSLNELQRVAAEYATVGAQLANDPAAAADLEAFQRFYGVQPTAAEVGVMAFADDLTVETLKQRISAVKIDAAAGRAGFGDLSRSEAEHLASIGVSDQQAQQGFGDLAAAQDSLGQLTGQQVDVIDRGTQLAGTFEGNANAARRIARRQREQVGLYSGGGGFASGNQGFGGAGSATGR